MKNKENMRNYIPGTIFLFLIALGLDQLTKSLSGAFLKGSSGKTLIPGLLKLYYLENEGAAFGMLNGRKFLFLAFAGLFLAAFIYFYRKVPKTTFYGPLIYSSVLLLSGAVGNAIDRILYGSVRDFIYISFIDFPVFNVADIYVVVSCILLVILVGFYYKDEDMKFLSRGKS